MKSSTSIRGGEENDGSYRVTTRIEAKELEKIGKNGGAIGSAKITFKKQIWTYLLTTIIL